MKIRQARKPLQLNPKMKKRNEHSGIPENAGNSSQTTKDTHVRSVKGIGPARSVLLEKLGIQTVKDILFYFPWRYEDRTDLKDIKDLVPGTLQTILCEVVSSEIIITPRKRFKIFELTVADSTGNVRAKWFNQAFLKKYFDKGRKVILSGIVKGNPYSGSGLEMENPEFELLSGEDTLVHTARIVPVYKATEGITQKQLRTLMFNLTGEYAALIKEYMPLEIIERNDLMPLDRAVKEAHFPEGSADVSALNRNMGPAHRRLIFDEFFMLELGLALLKKREALEKGISFNKEGALVKELIKGLPFDLTSSQQRVIDEIRTDMERPVPMNRLVHGDVGCGKTIVALAAMLKAVENGYQACLMAPTELLAEQHYINIHSMVESLGIRPVLLTSGCKDRPLDAIAGGDAMIVIGTHALIQEHVEFKQLGIAVIDEQHRFGVVQRAELRKKGVSPDILIMTATPIPRTLSLTLYGDLDISIIDELPAGRRPVITKVFFPSQKERIYFMLNDEFSKGRQIYVVYPLIEESEKLDLKSAIDGAEAFKKKFPEKRIGLIHGRMPAADRERVMSAFKAGEIDLLAATTVIEVGIDVSNASLMLIVHSERFGLSQLHQLRGRIGRGGHESYCLLMAYPPFTEDAKRRLKAMESTCNGFEIAEQDLAIRGPGDFFGTRQSGIPDLKIADIIRDIKILEKARKEAFELIEKEPLLGSCPLLKEAVHQKWIGKLELIKS